MIQFEPVDYDDFTPAMKQEHDIAMAVRDVMSGILQLKDAAQDHMGLAYIVSEIEDLRAAHVQLGRVLDNIEARSFADEQ